MLLSKYTGILSPWQIFYPNIFMGLKVFSQSKCNVETFQECLIYLELHAYLSPGTEGPMYVNNIRLEWIGAGEKLGILSLPLLEFDQD